MNPDGLNVRDLLDVATTRAPEHPFLVWDDRVVTYAEFARQTRAAADLWYQLGVRKGDRVVFMLDNVSQFLVAWLGLARVGGVLVAVNTGFRLSEASFIVEHSEARLALVGAEHANLFTQIATRIPRLATVLTTGGASRFPSYDELIEGTTGGAPPVELRGKDLISLVYTSGTTGRPKAVMQTHANYVLTGQAYPSWVRLRRGERVYCCLPLFHINSQAYTVMGAIGVEGTIVLARRFSASRFWDDIHRHRVNVFNFIGAMMVILCRAEPSPLDRQHEARVAYGAPALPPELRDEVERRFGLRVLCGFGMSETTFGLIESLEGERRPFSIGKPRQHPDPQVPPTEARLVDERGDEVPPGKVGELVLRSAAMMRGYYKDPERTADTLRNGWLWTGDLAYRDADGYYYYVDRKKDLIRHRGENVSSVEVEAVLQSHPAVEEAAVVGVPSPLTDEDLLAVVVPRRGHDPKPAELVDWCAERLAKFKVPRYVKLVRALPKTATQKVEKRTLREGWHEQTLFDREAAPSGSD